MLIESFSGIRGIYRKDIDENMARKYAFAFMQLLLKRAGEPKIIVGMDTRPQSTFLKEAMLDSLYKTTIDVGILPTPAIQNAVREFKADGGIILTASHNEPEFVGFKFLDKDGAVLRPWDIDYIIDYFHKIKDIDEIEFAEKYLNNDATKFGVKQIEKRHNEAKELYINFLFKLLKIKKNYFKNKIIIDPNGGTAILAKEILEKAGINVEGINMEEGKFKRLVEPNHDSLKYLKNKIKKNSFAAGFDCDGDRVEILDDKGNFLDGNYVLGLCVYYYLKFDNKLKNKINIVTNDVTSNLVRDIASDAKIIEVEVGEINVIDEMIKLGAPIGGEGSNGGVIVSPSRCRDGIMTILIILKLLKEKNKKLSEIIAEFPKYYSSRTKIDIKNKKIKKIKENIKKYFKNKKIQETGDISGGLKVIIDDNSYIWYRASKTEANALRVITDAKSKKRADELLEIGKKAIK